MKRFYQYTSGLLLAGVLSAIIVTTGYAQRGVGGHLGGGGHIGGGSVGFHGSSGLSVRGNTGNSGSFGIRNSVGVTRGNAGISYRTGNGYFAGTGYHGGAFYRPGFGYYGYPHVGFYLGVLPFGYYPFYWGSSLYYYYGGVFYSPYDNGGYQVTTPPLGAAVPDIPKNAQAIKIDGIQYYEVDGVYYKQTVNDKGEKIYVVAGRDGVLNTADSATDPNAEPTIAAPKIGDMVNQLPDGCRKVTLNGKKYFVSPNDIYYEKVTDPDGNVAYRITSLPEGEKEI